MTHQQANPFDFYNSSASNKSQYNSSANSKLLNCYSPSDFTINYDLTNRKNSIVQDPLSKTINTDSHPSWFTKLNHKTYINDSSLSSFSGSCLSSLNKQPFYSPSMGNPIHQLNSILSNPNKENILALFHSDGYIRLNMLYISPIALKHFRNKLFELGLINWSFTDNELVFKLKSQIVSFRGTVKIIFRETKIFCLELDFDPIISDNSAIVFLKEVEVFLKNCDAVFFMTYNLSIDSEVLNHPLSESLSFLASRK